MTATQDRGLKLAYFILGISVPLLGWMLLCRRGCFGLGGKQASVDRAHDSTVEDSFPASDPPSAW